MLQRCLDLWITTMTTNGRCRDFGLVCRRKRNLSESAVCLSMTRVRVSASFFRELSPSTLHPRPTCPSNNLATMVSAIAQPNATLYVSNIDWSVKKPLLRRALYSLFSRHGKVRKRNGLRRFSFCLCSSYAMLSLSLSLVVVGLFSSGYSS